MVLQLILLHVDSYSLLALNLLRSRSLLLLLLDVLLPQAVSNSAILDGLELTVLQGDLVYDDTLSFVTGSRSLFVQVLPFACTDNFTVAEADFT